MSGTVWYLVEEIFSIARVHAEKRPAAFLLGCLAAVLLVTQLLWWIASTFVRPYAASGDTLIKIYGQVLYDEGTEIPASSIMLSFVPEGEGVAGGGGRVCAVRVNSETGKFSSLLVCRQTGEAAVKYRVCVLAGPQEPLPEHVVSSEYAEARSTPLLVDVNRSPVDLRIRRPASKKGVENLDR